MSKPPKPQGEEPRSEPEIIPPGHAERGTERARVYREARPARRYFADLVVGLLSAVVMVSIRRFADRAACGCAVGYRRNRCRAIAVLFAFA
jgi:hypothetical protein